MSSLFAPTPPLHPTAGSHLSPRRREHVAQPPALTTSLSGLQYQGQGLGLTYSPAPLSTTSLSSPFSQSAHSPFLVTPGGAARGSSPMASRLSVAYPTAYNPREWGPVGRNSPSVGPGHTSQSRQSSTIVAPAPPRQLASDGEYIPSLQAPELFSELTSVQYRTSCWIATTSILTSENGGRPTFRVFYQCYHLSR